MILIPLSAGLDSTTLLNQALEKKETIETCYIQISNNQDKTIIEKQQREKIIYALKEKYSAYFKDNTGTEIKAGRNSVISMPQVPIWLCGLLYEARSEFSEIRLGYCMNDDAISFLSDIKRAWSSYIPFCHSKLPKLTFPLAKTSKYESKKTLPNEIFQLTYFCEDPREVRKKPGTKNYTWKDCGLCRSCKRAKYDETFYLYKRNQEEKTEKAIFSTSNFTNALPSGNFKNIKKAKYKTEDFEKL